jgi:hypothetical protein
MSSLQKDFVASHLHSQLITLQQLLDDIESSEDSGYDYALESLRRVETDLRKLRAFLTN